MSNPYISYAQHVTMTPQSRPIPGREAQMAPNSAGGYGFIMDDWERLTRFLVMGSSGGTYYIGEQKLTAENAGAVIRCIKADGIHVISMAADINIGSRAPKTDPQLFVLALAMKHGDEVTKREVALAAPSMLRTGTHLLHFVAILDAMGGWSRARRRIVTEWFNKHTADQTAFQVLKYQNRDGWTMRDVLRVAHPMAETEAHDAVYAWVCGKVTDAERPFLPDILADHATMMTMKGTPITRALWGIEHGLPREALPTEAINTPEVQRALLPSMPLHALIRNLGNLTASGTLTNPAASAIVTAKLTDKDALRRARVHPFAILLATLVYKTGSGIRGSKTWIPAPAVLSALEDAYDLAFDAVTPTGKRILVAIDISGSMSASCIGTPIPASTAAVAMAITLARLEPHAMVVQFDVAVQRIVPVTRRTGIAGLEATSEGGTNLAAPVRWAMGVETGRVRARIWGGGFIDITPKTQLSASRQDFDAIVILSDNETWAGKQHCAETIAQYRKNVNPRTKLIVCAMAANNASVVDPDDPLQFGCAGLDANLPGLVADFIAR